ncbi:MFS transporter [Streptomyces sp. NPDC050504]|uniref:MFS transporter n=1 Tax=Streptomyces sp. NPDC050504 TaxID=3365618 RepID=UPI0037AB23B1
MPRTKSAPASLAATAPSPSPSPTVSLVAAVLGFGLIMLDGSVVNVALPPIGAALGGGMTGLQWVVDAYTLAFAALLLSTGALTDRIGAGRAYGIGIALFTAASVACGLAPSLPVLIGARIAQGVAASIVLPTTLALVRQAYADPARRTRAVSLWAAGGMVAAALGPVAGGALTSVLDWRAIFFINLPLGLAALALGARVPRSPRRPAPLDLPGQAAAAVGLTALVLAVIERGTTGWIAGGVAVVALGAFVRIERRQAHPVVPFGLFRDRTVAVAVAAGSAISVVFYGSLFVFSLYFQQELDLSPLATGLVFLPMTGLLSVVNVLSSKVANRYGPRVPMLVGQSVSVAGLLLVLAVGVDPGVPPLVTSLLLVPMSLGCGFALPPLTAAMMEAVPAERAGIAAGVLNAARQVSGALGIAVFGALGAGASGIRGSLLIGVVLLAGTLTATFTLRRA